jgi:hypothetical protein
VPESAAPDAQQSVERYARYGFGYDPVWWSQPTLLVEQTVSQHENIENRVSLLQRTYCRGCNRRQLDYANRLNSDVV